MVSDLMKTRLLILLTACTSRTSGELEEETRTRSPGTMFHHFILSLAGTALSTLPSGAGLSAALRTGSRWRKLLVSGERETVSVILAERHLGGETARMS